MACSAIQVACCMLCTHLVLGLGFRWLKWAGQDGKPDILKLFWHLWMAHVLVYNNAVYQLGIF